MENNGFYLEKKFYHCPKSYDELSPSQAIAVNEILACQQPRDLAIARLLPVLFAIEKHPRLAWFLANKMTDVELYDLALLTEPFFDTRPSAKCLVPTLTLRQKFPKPNLVFHSAGDNMVNLSFYEFIKAEKYFLDFCRSKQNASLDKLAATIYRPAKKKYKPEDGDIRQPFNDNLVAARATTFAALPHGAKLAVLFQYAAWREAIEKQFPLVFAAPTDEEKGRPNYGWLAVLLQLAGDKFGDDEQTARKSIHLILAHLQIQLANKPSTEDER